MGGKYIMVNDRAIAYSEVYAILNLMNPKYINKIPSRLKLIIKEEMDKEYKPEIKYDIPLTEQKLNKKTFTILAMLNLNYWCETQEHKNELIKLYANNDKIKEEELREKYNPDNLFKNKETKIETVENTVAMVEYKESIFTKIKNWFKRTS